MIALTLQNLPLERPLRNRSGRSNTHLLLQTLQKKSCCYMSSCTLSPRGFLSAIFSSARMTYICISNGLGTGCPLVEHARKYNNRFMDIQLAIKGHAESHRRWLQEEQGSKQTIDPLAVVVVSLCNKDSQCLPARDKGCLGWGKVCSLMHRKIKVNGNTHVEPIIYRFGFVFVLVFFFGMLYGTFYGTFALYLEVQEKILCFEEAFLK